MTFADIFDKDVVLENDVALLRPMLPDDFEGFKAIAFDKDIWTFTLSSIFNEQELHEYMANAFQYRKDNSRYTFTIIDKATNTIAGSTSYLNIFPKDLRLEIGATWLGTDYHKTGLNRACKSLLLHYAFNDLGVVRVEFRTDALNLRSRKALQKIGAQEEGILRSHCVRYNHVRRDSVCLSIIKSEWDFVKKKSFMTI